MNSHLVFGDATEQDLEAARLKWELNRKRAAWGCKWFELWLEKVREAVQMGQRLQVAYFPGEVGCGKVSWKMLPPLGWERLRRIAEGGNCQAG